MKLVVYGMTILTLQILSIFADSCFDNVCEFTFKIRRRRTMSYTAKNGNTYNVAWNSTENQLQIIENSSKKKERYPMIGDFIKADEVITTDGYSRNIIVINDQFPGPTIEVKSGAQVVVHVVNELYTEGIVMHWHGMAMRNNVWMDGADYVTQCPILPHQSFTYRFIAEPAGTHWYHGHFSNQRLDGLQGALIVHEPTPPVLPYHIMTVQDWYHHEAETLQIVYPYSTYKGTGEAANTTDVFFTADGSEITLVSYVNTLVNGRGRSNSMKLPLQSFDVTSRLTYTFRVVNTGAEYVYEIMVDNHQLTIVASDGQPLQHTKVDSFVLWVGESIDFYITADQPISSYWIRSNVFRVSTGMPLTYDGIEYGGKAILIYGNQTGDPISSMKNCTMQNPCKVFNCPFSGFADHLYKQCITFENVNSQLSIKDLNNEFGINDNVVEEIFLNIGFHIGSSFNSRKFSFPKAPLMGDYEQYITRCNAATCETGCRCTNIIDLPLNKTVQMVISNMHPGNVLDHHPMHIHGHNFAVMKIGFPEYNTTTGLWSKANSDVVCDTDSYCAHPKWNNNKQPTLRTNQQVPVKDTLTIPARGYVVLRFKTNNPGYWMMHCHQQSHLFEGMTLLLNEGHGYHPQVPKNFAKCGNFDWTQEEFTKYLQGKQTTTTPSTTQSRVQPTTTTQPPANPSPLSANCNLDEVKRILNQQNLDNQKTGITLETNSFIGAMVGFVLIGAVLGVIPMLIYVCISKGRNEK